MRPLKPGVSDKKWRQLAMCASPLAEKDKEFAYAFLADRESYHSHKENSAYAVFLVEAGLFSALFTTDRYKSIACQTPNSPIVFVMLVLFVWTLLHVFMRWQLKNRRIAAIQVSTLLSSLLDHLNETSEIEIEEVNEKPSLRKVVFDYFLPVPSSTVYSDVQLKAYPEWYRKRYLIAHKAGTGASFAEIFPTYGSLLMLLASMAYVLFLG